MLAKGQTRTFTLAIAEQYMQPQHLSLTFISEVSKGLEFFGSKIEHDAHSPTSFQNENRDLSQKRWQPLGVEKSETYWTKVLERLSYAKKFVWRQMYYPEEFCWLRGLAKKETPSAMLHMFLGNAERSSNVWCSTLHILYSPGQSAYC